MMGTNDAGDGGATGQGGGGDRSPDPGPSSPHPGYREGVHGEPVPDSAWQADPTVYQQPPYPAAQYGSHPPPYGGGPPGPPGGYPGPYPPGPYPLYRPTNGMAVASMVLGILWLYWIGSILALIFGYIARQQIRERGEGGDGMAVAGIVLGWIWIGLLVLGIGIAAVAAATDGFR